MGISGRRRLSQLLPVPLLFLAACSGFDSGLSTTLSSVGPSTTATFSGLALNSVSAACDQFKAKMAGGGDSTLELQACIDSAAVGSTLELPPGVANVSQTIHVAKALSLRTAGSSGGALCDTADKHACFELRALANMMSVLGQGLLSVTGTGASVESIVINGNRLARLNSAPANACRNGDNGQAYNMQVAGSGIRLRGVVSKQSLCGSAMYVAGDHLDISGNAIVQNGDHRDLFSDGMTVTEAADSVFKSNLFIDNTDVDFIFGGCPRCVIQGNVVRHNATFPGSSFAAMMLHAWPKDDQGKGGTSGNYTGADVSGNLIDCGAQRRCGIGLYLGAESWYSAPLFGGFFHDNTISNALNGFVVEKASGLIRIKDNVVSSSGGFTWTSKQRIESAYAYNIPDRANVQIEDTKIANSAYKSISLSRSIPNFWSREVAYNTAPGSVLLESLFVSLLGRLPDASGINTARSLSCQAIGNMVANSPEANGIYAGQSTDTFVRYIYSGVLGRPVEADGLRLWSAEIDSGRRDRAAVINFFLSNQEYANRCASLGF